VSAGTYDVAIVGAGIVGCACALELARDGRSVVVLEAVGIASDTSCRAMGHVGVYDDSPAQMSLSAYGVACWNDLAFELPPEVDFVRRGALWLAADEPEMAEVEGKLHRYRESGIEAHRVDRAVLADMEPHLSRDLAGALYVPGDIVLDAAEATKHLADRARKVGAEFRFPDRVRELAASGPILASGESVRAERTVLAAGWRAPELWPSLAVRPRKGHIALLAPREGFVRHQLSEIGYVRGAQPEANDVISFSLQPRSTGRYLLGATRQYVGPSSDVDPRVMERLFARARRYLPDIDTLTVERTWTGLRPAGPRSVPLIGPVPGRNDLYFAVGHEGIGITTCIATGRIVRDLMSGRSPPIPVEPFLPDPAANHPAGQPSAT
jgi:D-hydroxyproline dehydrogenase subunit beta